MSKRALIFWGGWEGHEPEATAKLFAGDLEEHGFAVTLENSLESLANSDLLQTYDLISPCWTMGKLTDEQSRGLSAAVNSGVGLAGIHGGMGDAFRGNTEYEWMVGGHFVGHPHVGDYSVRRSNANHELGATIPETFTYRSEQYYLLVDPGNTVLAETTYHHEGRDCSMPVVWVKYWGRGRVFYSSLGHQPQEFLDFPEVRNLTISGMLWAAR